MKTSVLTGGSYAMALITPICIVGVTESVIGAGNGEIYPIGLLCFVPFAIGAGLASAVKGKLLQSWIVLVGIFAASIYGFLGLYGAFFRVPARGAFEVIYRPIAQTALMVAIGLIVILPILIGKLKDRGRGKP
jgi:hypothetical protein